MTAAHMHGVLGHDGLSPLRLLELGRQEVAGYGVRIIHGDVTAARTDGAAIEVDIANETIRDSAPPRRDRPRRRPAEHPRIA